MAVAAAAAAAAAPLGVVAASNGRTWAFAAIGGAAVAFGMSSWFRRDAAMAITALWAFQIFRTPLAAALKSAPGAGALVNQLTDVCLLVILLTLAAELLRPGASARDLRFFGPAVGLAAFGLTSSLAQSAPLAPTLIGLWLGTKFWLLVGVTGAMSWRRDDVERIMRVIVPFGAAAAGLGLLDFATGGAIADALKSNLRVTPLGTYRSGAAQSLYAHPNEYSLAMSLLVAVWLSRIASRARVRARDLALLALLISAAIVSLRLKAVLSISAVFAVVTIAQLARGRREGIAMLAIGAVALALIFAFMGNVIHEQLSTYSSSQSTARAQLYRVGVRIADRHVPFGVGFGRFASAPSRDYYSPVYDDYGLSKVWGLSRDFPRFIADTSWPAVMGETGYGGLLVFVGGLLALLLAGLRALRGAGDAEAFAPLAMLCVLVVILVDSSGNPNLFSWNAITVLALFAGATLAQQRARADREAALYASTWDRGLVQAPSVPAAR
ncbi:MAG TPA: hypothetical protein VNT03_07210 [Baekduia sp.]|nr:hypothetical protein [Baekduia sp.]